MRNWGVLPFIDLQAQYRAHKQQIDARIHQVLDHGQYILGPEVEELEQRLAARVGAAHCISCSSGTDALLLALLALGLGPGDEVITTPFTFFATGEMVSLLGAVPVLVDIEPDTKTLNPALVEAAITPRTRAILPVSLYGQPASMDEIAAIAGRRGIPLIEDAAQSFGSVYRGRHSGALGTVGCTSFFPSKPLGCYGDGGACFTSDPSLAEKLRQLRNHGQEARYRHAAIGINGRLDTLQAAVLLAKLDVFDRELVARGENANQYSGALLALEKKGKLRLPKVRPDRTSVWAQYTVEVEDRGRVAEHLQAAGIPTAVHYPVALHQQPAYASGAAPYRVAGAVPVADQSAERVLSLPMHPYLSRPAIDRVTRALEAALAG